MRYYPENTTTSFTTELPQRVNLQGQWEVALTEIQFPYSFLHIRPGKDTEIVFVAVEEDDERRDVKSGIGNITPGVYTTTEELLQAVNHVCRRLDTHIILRVDAHRAGRVTAILTCIDSRCLRRHYIRFSNKLNRMLGFDMNVQREELVYLDICSSKKGEISWYPESSRISCGEKQMYAISSETKDLLADEPASVTRGIPDKLFVYCDICEPYVTGDVHSPLLRVVPVEHSVDKYTYGSNTVRHFSHPNYIPLRLTSFRTIEIDIRDQVGEKIPFEFGTLTVTLQFRRSD